MMETQSKDSRVAVLGMGIMGAGMARSLLRAGVPTTVWNRSAAAAGALADAGATVASSPVEAVKAAGVVITMLPTAQVVNAVMFKDGVIQAFPSGAVWAQMGTIGVKETEEAAQRVRALRPDVIFVDAPVSGSKGPAEKGQLLIFGSGPPKAEALVAPTFAAVGRKTVWLGEVGQGSRMKLVINAYLAMVIQGLAESLELAERMGIDTAKVAAAIQGGPLDAPIATAKLHKMASGDFAPEFPLRWALKDVDLALAAAGPNPPPVLSALSSVWQAAVDADADLGGEDISAARRALQRGPA